MKTNNLKQHFNDFSSIYLTQALFNGCFYAIRAIFILYAINQFSLNQAQAINLFATFMILCYGTSLIGGYIADQGLGVKNTIMLGGVLSTLGLLCVLSPSQDLCFLGLALASLGSGFFKPNISTAIGLLFKDPKDPKKDRACSVFYIAANFGGLIAPIVCGFVGETCGWHFGIGLIAGVFMGATFFVYKTMQFHSSHKERLTISKGKLLGSNLALIILFYLLFKYRESFHGLMGIITCGSIVCLGKIFYQCRGQEKKDVLTVGLYIFLFALFCTLYEQAGTSLMLFYEKAVDRQIMGSIIPSSTFLSLDPLFVLLCGPILLFVSSKYLEKRNPMNGFVKVGCGFLCVAASFAGLAASTWQDNAFSIHILWIVGATFIQTIGELLIAPISFAKISQLAPPRFKSILMSFWSMAIAYGHYFAGFIAQYSLESPIITDSECSFETYRNFFFHLAVLPLCIGLLLLLFQGLKYYLIKMGGKHFIKIKKINFN